MKDGFVKVAAATPVIKVADVEFNTKNIIECMEKAAEQGTKVLAFPELCVTGYTCGDLFFQKTLLDAAVRGLIEIAVGTEGIDMLVLVGAPLRVNGSLYDCGVALCDGVICGVVSKTNVTDTRSGIFPGTEEEDLLFKGEFVDFGTNLMFCHEGMEGFMSPVRSARIFGCRIRPPSVLH
jgi:NAD+ synthase (glutamine-hydrolysing)